MTVRQNCEIIQSSIKTVLLNVKLYYVCCTVDHCQGQSAERAHSEQAVVAHACHGHRYRPSPVPPSVLHGGPIELFLVPASAP